MFKTIVVPIDGSDHASKAVDIATDLADKYDARLLLLNVYKPTVAMENTHSMVRAAGVSPEDAMRDFSRETVHEAGERARARGARQLQTFVVQGPIARTIVDFARDQRADAIVMGSRGLGDVSGLLLGSVSHKVSHLAACTCIMVK